VVRILPTPRARNKRRYARRLLAKRAMAGAINAGALAVVLPVGSTRDAARQGSGEDARRGGVDRRRVAAYLVALGGKAGKKSPLFVTEGQGKLRGHRLGVESIRRLFRSLNRNSRKHVHPHLLRHSMAVPLLKNGVGIRYLQAILGHESADTTSKYLGLVKDDITREYDAAMERILGE